SAGTLAYGQQRRLEIARCMMTRPSILMLDEPAAGLNPRETEDLKALIGVLRDEHNVTVLLIEHDMGLVMDISHHVVVLNFGQVIGQGTPAQVRANPEVVRAYLGDEASRRAAA
ncbi:MAG: ATP-binding cassette domain-containing protein, partial [Rubrivivax sp.]